MGALNSEFIVFLRVSLGSLWAPELWSKPGLPGSGFYLPLLLGETVFQEPASGEGTPEWDVLDYPPLPFPTDYWVLGCSSVV